MKDSKVIVAINKGFNIIFTQRCWSNNDSSSWLFTYRGFIQNCSWIDLEIKSKLTVIINKYNILILEINGFNNLENYEKVWCEWRTHKKDILVNIRSNASGHHLWWSHKSGSVIHAIQIWFWRNERRFWKLFTCCCQM